MTLRGIIGTLAAGKLLLRRAIIVVLVVLTLGLGGALDQPSPLEARAMA